MRRLLVIRHSETALGSWSESQDVHIFPTTASAIHGLQRLRPHAILLTPQTTLAETLRSIQLLRDISTVPVLLLGPKTDAELVREALLAGASDYISNEDIGPATISLAVECAIAREGHAAEESRRVFERHAAALRADRERLRKSLINQIADRLHNPMTVVRLKSRVLRGKCPPEILPALDSLDSAVARLDELIGQVTTAFRAQQNELDLESSSVDLWPLTLDVLKEPEFSDRRADITVARGSDPAVVRGDDEGCRRVVRYLLRQACRLTVPEQVIGVFLCSSKGGIELALQVPRKLEPDEADSLFEAFSGSDDEAHRIDLGLELYVARLLTNQMGARIALSSDTNGALIRVSFAKGNGRTEGKCVAVVAGDSETVREVRQTVRKLGTNVRVVAAPTWEAAAPSLPDGRADIVVLNLENDEVSNALQAHLEQLSPPVHVIDGAQVRNLPEAIQNAMKLPSI